MQTNDPLIQDILSKIEFRLIQPTEPGTFVDTMDITRVDAFRGFDFANTVVHDTATKIVTLDFLRTPRLSTLANAYIINRLVKAMPENQVYLNVGVWCGFSLIAGMIGNEARQCIGVDNFSDPKVDTKGVFMHQYTHFKTPASQFYEMDYLDYFKQIHKEQIGVYFYDGDHAYQHQLKGLEIADPFMAPGCYVIVDDTNWPEPYDATMDFVRQQNGKYEVVFDIKTANNSHPTFWNGLLILKKK